MSKINMLNGDCMELMRSVPENFYSIAIVDPPYGINAGKMTMGKGSGNDKGLHAKKEWDTSIPSKDYFDELFRVSKNQIIWGGNYFLEHLGATPCMILWDKLDYNSDFASHEIAWTSFRSPTKCFQRARSKGGDSKNKIHPTQKPVALYEWLLKKYANYGDTILDTHGGSGSSCIACYNLGFDIDWIEKDLDYYSKSVRRFEEYKETPVIFAKEETCEQIAAII